jgi:hypothetical protein
MADVVSESIRAALVDADALIARVNAALAGDPSCVNVTVDSHSDETAGPRWFAGASACSRIADTPSHRSSPRRTNRWRSNV